MKKNLALFLVSIAMSMQLFSQTMPAASMHTSKQVMDDFMSKRFGMFIHWGPVTLRGTEIGWSRGHQYR